MDERKRMLYFLYRAKTLPDFAGGATAPIDDRLREVNTAMNSEREESANREGSVDNKAGDGGPKSVDGQQSVVNEQRSYRQQTVDSLESVDNTDSQPSTDRQTSTPRTSPTPGPIPNPICPDCIDIGLEKCECEACWLSSGLCSCREMRDDLMEILWQLVVAIQTEHWARGDAAQQMTSYVTGVRHDLATHESDPVQKWYNEETFCNWAANLRLWAVDGDGKPLAWAPLTAAALERLTEWNRQFFE